MDKLEKKMRQRLKQIPKDIHPRPYKGLPLMRQPPWWKDLCTQACAEELIIRRLLDFAD